MNWLQRQFSDQINQDPDSLSSTAIAAAAFAIWSLEEAEITRSKNQCNKEDARSRNRHSSKLIRQHTSKNTKKAADGNMKRPSKAPEKANSAIKPSHYVGEKRERNSKLKSIFSWAKERS